MTNNSVNSWNINVNCETFGWHDPPRAIFTVLDVKNGDKPQIGISLTCLPIIIDYSIYLKIYVFDGGKSW